MQMSSNKNNHNKKTSADKGGQPDDGNIFERKITFSKQKSV